MQVAQAKLAHHFEDLEQQHEAGSLGMWAFLVTEVMVFGVLFAGYTVMRYRWPAEFAAASSHLSVWLGGGNTIVLLTSSLTMALAVHAAHTNSQRVLIVCLLITAALGATFLGVKAFEYWIDHKEYLVPGLAFRPNEWAEQGVRPAGVQMFLVLYYVMTGLHAMHMIAGIGTILVLAVLAWRGWFSPEYYIPVEATGLYWHFVDVVWIFLLPLLYLVGRH